MGFVAQQTKDKARSQPAPYTHIFVAPCTKPMCCWLEACSTE